MNRYETSLFVSILVFFFPAFAIYHYMLLRVNRQLPPDRKLPHSLTWRGWNRLAKEYKSLYPKSSLYQLALSFAVTALILAVVLLALRFWEYLGGR